MNTDPKALAALRHLVSKREPDLKWKKEQMAVCSTHTRIFFFSREAAAFNPVQYVLRELLFLKPLNMQGQSF